MTFILHCPCDWGVIILRVLVAIFNFIQAMYPDTVLLYGGRLHKFPLYRTVHYTKITMELYQEECIVLMTYYGNFCRRPP
jgi:hypothetical protein